jgi:MFS family permease
VDSTRRRTLGFWLIAATSLVFFAASSAPTPLYIVYQTRWHFSASVLTLVFATYVATLLLSLLTTGGLSNFIGRRRVIAGALVVELLSMLVFLSARDVAALFAARAIQGLATGAAAGALSAGLADLAPRGRAALAAAVNTAAPTSGLAVGALASGALVQYAPAPRVLVYAILAALFLALAVAVPLLPETGEFRAGALRSLRPRAAVPAQARRAFRAAAPVLVASWAVGGLVLSLGPSLAVGIFGVRNHLIGGLVVTAVAGVGAVAAVIVRSRPARTTMVGASVVLAVGVAVVLVSLAVTSTPGFFAGLVITGAGFGSAFVAALGSVAPLAAPDQRAELFASIFIVSYAGFGGSAVLVGLAVPPFGLRPTAIVFGAAVIVLALLAAATGARRVPAHRGHRISTARAQREVVPIVEAAPRVEAVSVVE